MNTRLLLLTVLAALSLSAQQSNLADNSKDPPPACHSSDGRAVPCLSEYLTIPSGSDVYFKRETSVSMPEKLRLTQAQLQAQMALTALLQSKEYAALQRANEATQQIVTEIETAAGCKIDIAKAECLPAPKSETAKPSGNPGK